MDEGSELYSGGVATKAPRNVFSVEKANRSLPLVRRVVADIVALYRQIALTQQRLTSDSLNDSERSGLEAVADQQDDAMAAFLEELGEIGCELKDANMGLVDFIGRHDGRDVSLCWRLGEERIAFWHELHGGYAGRRPISSLREKP